MKRIGTLGELPDVFRLSDVRLERKGFMKLLSFKADDVPHRLEMMERGHSAFSVPVDFERRLAYLMRAPRHLRAFAYTEAGRAAIAQAIATGNAPETIEVPAEVIVTWSVSAGIIEPGESDETTADREMFEELGLNASGPQQRVASVTASIGGTTERLELFIAPVTDLQEHAEPQGDGSEKMQVYQMTFDELFRLQDDGKIPGVGDYLIVERIRRLDLERQLTEAKGKTP